jgi:hypothetical protein
MGPMARGSRAIWGATRGYRRASCVLRRLDQPYTASNLIYVDSAPRVFRPKRGIRGNAEGARNSAEQARMRHPISGQSSPRKCGMRAYYPPKSKHSTLKNSTFEVASQLGKRCVSLTLGGRWLRHRSGLRWRLVKVGGPERQSRCQEATERPEIPCYILLQTRYLSACYLTP